MSCMVLWLENLAFDVLKWVSSCRRHKESERERPTQRSLLVDFLYLSNSAILNPKWHGVAVMPTVS